MIGYNYVHVLNGGERESFKAVIKTVNLMSTVNVKHLDYLVSTRFTLDVFINEFF